MTTFVKGETKVSPWLRRWSKNFDSEEDWNLVTEPSPGAHNRQVKASRGRFLGGSSGCNGTLCIRGTKQDYDSWNMPGWSGEEMWEYMAKVCNYFYGFNQY
jgi:choline dehydrogenase-like flavoprotein